MLFYVLAIGSFIAEQYFIAWIDHNLFTHLYVDGHLNCLQFLASHYLIGLGVLLLNINNFTEHLYPVYCHKNIFYAYFSSQNLHSYRTVF